MSRMFPARTISQSKRPRNPLRKVTLLNFTTGEHATIFPSLGGRVHEIVLRHGKELHSLLDSPMTMREIIENKHFAGAKLIPFAGRIPEASYRFDGKRYTMRAHSRSNVAIHGFVADKPFKVVKSTAKADQASVVMTYTHGGTTKGYPFKFAVRLTFVLRTGSFSCTTEIRNTDSRPIPVGDGWHPYFRTAGPGASFLLSLPSHSVVEITPMSKVPTGTIRDGSTRTVVVPLGNDVLDSVFDLGLERRRVTTKVIDEKKRLEVQIWQESGKGRYRYLVVYRPPSGSSVAIEPWTCAPNSFNNQMGLIVLKPGGKFKASYGVRLQRRRRSHQ